MSVLKTRKELMVVDENHGGYLTGHCAVCGDPGWIGKIAHKLDCLLRDPGVTHVSMVAVKTKVVLRGRHGGKLWWQSVSGVTYDIERRGLGCGTYYVMTARSTGNAVQEATRLSDIRKYIVANQGVL